MPVVALRHRPEWQAVTCAPLAGPLPRSETVPASVPEVTTVARRNVVCGLPLASSKTCRAPDWRPDDVPEKPTPTLHVAAGAIVAPAQESAVTVKPEPPAAV